MNPYNRRKNNESNNNFNDEMGAFIEFKNLSDESLQKIDGLDLLTSKSKDTFINHCSRIKVPANIERYHPLIISHQNEVEYRKVRDEEHKFKSISMSMFINTTSKIELRNNKAVIPIVVSENQIKRAYRIIDTLLNAVKEFNGIATVEPYEDDNLYINLFGTRFSFVMTEHKVKYRSMISGPSQENKERSFRPRYERLYNGELEIEIKQVSYGMKDKVSQSICFADNPDYKIETCLGEIFINLRKIANEAKVAEYITERESKKILQEQERLNKIEVENKRLIKELEKRNHLKKILIENIEHQMDSWFNSQNLLKYANELESIASEITDEVEKALILEYITLVRKKAEGLNPIKEILKDMKVIGMDAFKE